MHGARELFNRWYMQPLKQLAAMENGDGGFVALAVSCSLYERYATAVIERSKGEANKQAKLRQFMVDFETDMNTAEAFWNVIRNGLAHQAMPLQIDRAVTHPPWWFHDSHRKAAELATVDGQQVLKVQPWHFMNKVLSLWQEN